MGKIEPNFVYLNYEGITIKYSGGFLGLQSKTEKISFDRISLGELLKRGFRFREEQTEKIILARDVETFGIELDTNQTYYKEYDNFTLEYDASDESSWEPAYYTLKFNDNNLKINRLTIYQIEEEIKKRNFSEEEIKDFFLWHLIIHDYNRVAIEIFINNRSSIPRKKISRAKKLAECFLTTGTITSFIDEEVEEAMEFIDRLQGRR